MSGRNPYGGILFQISALLSQQVSNKDGFFKEIALMDLDSKEKYAIFYWMNETDILNANLDEMSIDEIIEKFVMPLLQRLGQSKYKADVLTNLGWKVGQETGIGVYDLDE